MAKGPTGGARGGKGGGQGGGGQTGSSGNGGKGWGGKTSRHYGMDSGKGRSPAPGVPGHTKAPR